MICYSRMASVFVLAGALLGSVAAIAESTIDEIGERITDRLPGFVVSSLTATEVQGLFEVVSDGRIYYIDESAEYLIDGSLIRLEDRLNVTDSRLGSIHMGLIEGVDEKNMLIYEPEEASTRSITVFTDISCGYCRRLHAEIDTLLEAGIRVRYLMFPRGGIGSQGHKDLESVWCADDPQGAMTNAKAGGKIEAKTCPNPIEEHVALAERLGLRGTPLIYTDSGEKIPGYREASALAQMINNSEPLTR
jgi:thiol:disulfide interchange protein DsbC